jgi:hypothetical protein
MTEQNERIAVKVQRVNSQRSDSKRRVSKIEAAKYLPCLRQDAPRMLRAYGSIEKLADQLKIRRGDALNLVLLALVERKPLQKRRAK